MDEEVIFLARNYLDGNSSLEQDLYSWMIEFNLIPVKYLKLLAFLGDAWLPVTPGPDRPDNDEAWDEENEDLDLDAIMGEVLDMVSQRPDERPFPYRAYDFQEGEVDHQLLVYLVGLYLRAALGWLFTEDPEWCWRFNVSLWSSFDKDLRNQTRATVLALLTWFPGAWMTSSYKMIPHIDERFDERIAAELVSRGEDETNSSTLLGALYGLFDKLSPSIQWHGGKEAWSNLQRLALDSSGSRGFPAANFIDSCYEVWEHSGHSLDELHQQILPYVRTYLIRYFASQL